MDKIMSYLADTWLVVFVTTLSSFVYNNTDEWWIPIILLIVNILVGIQVYKFNKENKF